jgi:hypothetical protein
MWAMGSISTRRCTGSMRPASTGRRLRRELREGGITQSPKGVPLRDIAEVIGRRLNVPVVSKSLEETASHFGWLGNFLAINLQASSAETQKRLGLIDDLNRARHLEG